MEKLVVFSEEFHQAIEELVVVLFEKEYLGFKKDCQIYADRIYDFIENNIDGPVSKASPAGFQKYGQRYIKYKANQHTTWYIFFSVNKARFLVNHIINNHSNDFSEFL